jgi:hypothetical protein
LKRALAAGEALPQLIALRTYSSRAGSEWFAGLTTCPSMLKGPKWQVDRATLNETTSAQTSMADTQESQWAS